MKLPKTLILNCFVFLCCFHSFAQDIPKQYYYTDGRSDSTVFLYVKALRQASEVKIRGMRNPDTIGYKKEHNEIKRPDNEKITAMDRIDLMRVFPKYVFIHGTPSALPLDSLINFRMDRIESIKILLEDSPLNRALYGSVIDYGVIIIYPMKR